MVRVGWKALAICAIAHGGVSSAAAEPLPVQKSLALGRPARSQQIVLAERSGLVAKIAGAAVTLPARGVKTASVESIAVASDAAVAIVRASAANGEWVVLLGGKNGRELLLADRTDLVGDPGERRATVVEVRSDAASGVGAIMAGVRYEGMTLCGTQRPLLAARRTLDPKTLKLVPQLSALETPPNAPLLAAQPGPRDGRAPLLRALSPLGSSQVDDSTQTTVVPRSLIDDRPDTLWDAHSGDAALLRWSATGLPIERLEIRVAPRLPPEPAAPLTLFMDKATFRSELPNGPAPEDTWSIALPAKTITSCLVVAVGDVPNGLQIAELRAFSELDRERGGMDKLVSSLIQDGDDAARAADLLADLGEPAARAVAARFGELSVQSQRRALKVLANGLALPEVRARVVEAARSPDEHLSATALTTLSRGKAPGAIGLRELALLNEPAGEAAARVLVLSTPSEAGALLAALSTPEGPDRASLRRALVSVAQRDARAFQTAVDAWLAATPPVSARLGLALVAGGAALPELGKKLLEGALEDTQAFADRYRLALAAAELPASEAIDAWLSQHSISAEEWMIRRAAYTALAKRNPDAAESITLYLANDEYPRVRAAAVPFLAGGAEHAERLALLAGKDPWPLVRSAAATALAGVPGSRPVLEKLVDDTSRRVRTAAIDSLTAQRARESWPLIEQRLSATNEWPEVQAAAVRFVSALCLDAARPHLTHLVRRALRPDANDDDRRLGMEALRALHELGGEAAKEAKQLATREAAAREFQVAIAAPAPPRCTSKPATP
jgi:hypothetical protein